MSILACSSITVAFYRGRGGWYNRLVRLWSWSPYSHCELKLSGVLPGVLENAYLTTDPTNGVHVHAHPPSGAGTNDADWDNVTLPITEEERRDIQTFIFNEIGCGYDWKGIFLSQMIGLRREHPSEWFCSELCAAVLKRSNCGLALLRKRPCEYSPASLRKAIAS
jgi:hypothetical protein